MRWLKLERVRYAQTLLEKTEWPLATVDEQSGFTDPQLMRLHFRRAVGTSPHAYRQSFKRR